MYSTPQDGKGQTKQDGTNLVQNQIGNLTNNEVTTQDGTTGHKTGVRFFAVYKNYLVMSA